MDAGQPAQHTVPTPSLGYTLLHMVPAAPGVMTEHVCVVDGAVPWAPFSEKCWAGPPGRATLRRVVKKERHDDARLLELS